jgi:ABC-type sugar transport system ATPase subunit
MLALEAVGKAYGRGAHERVALRDVSFEVSTTELVVVWGGRHSGRSTLMRLSAGVERPDEGVVRWDGRDLAGAGMNAQRLGIAYCRCSQRPAEGQLVLEQLVVDQLARGVRARAAESAAADALARVGADDCSERDLRELDTGEHVRVAVARALTQGPRLLVIDEPLLGVELLARDGILLLLRSLADSGLGVLMSTGETTAFSGADRALVLDGGRLSVCAEPDLAPVLHLRRPA